LTRSQAAAKWCCGARALPDRYGRIVAYAYARRDDGGTFV